MNKRSDWENDDLLVINSLEVETEEGLPRQLDRYVLPPSSRFPQGRHFFDLLKHDFEILVDGKPVEEVEFSQFRTECVLTEPTERTDASPTLRSPESREGIDAVSLGAGHIDWFELHPKFFFKGTEISSELADELSRQGMIEFQGKLYRIRAEDLPSLKRLTRFWLKLRGDSSAALPKKRRRTEETYFRLARHKTLELLALRAMGVGIRGGPQWQKICAFYDSLHHERPTLHLPSSFHAQLQSFQTVGVRWLMDLYELGLGCILADDMGLGKTVTSLAFLEWLRTEGRMGPCLVVVPTSLTFNWSSEAHRFAPKMPVTQYQTRDQDGMLDFLRDHTVRASQGDPSGALVICTYGLLQENSEFLQQVDWNCIIFDEAQNLKNLSTKRTTAARQMRGSFKICLTGTPLENHYGEFYSLFDLTVPGALGELSSFRERYVNPERVLREDLDDLRLKVKPLLLRRTKSQVMSELPPKVETTIRLPFEDEQRRIYRDIASAYNEQVRNAVAAHGESKVQLQMLTALLRLRQACSDPSAIPGVKYNGEPPKISTLVDALKEIVDSGASALVFTQFLATYGRIRNAMLEKKIRAYDINGSDSRTSRENKIRGFVEEPESSVMLMTLKTGGVGLNLTKASYIFHVEPWWNPAVESQATDRAHRLGQQKTVQVYRYIIRESVEEKIELLKEIKMRRFDALFSVSEAESDFAPSDSHITQADFEFLLGLDPSN